MSYKIINNYLKYLAMHTESQTYFEGVKNSSNGKDLYILGSGPSLLILDKNKLAADVDIIYLNYAIAFSHPVVSGNRYLAVTDVLRIVELRDYVTSSLIDVISSSDKVFNPAIDWRVYCGSKFIIPNVNYAGLSVDFSQSFSMSIDRGVYIGYTVLFIALQFALHLRPRRVILAGIDMTSNKAQYFDTRIKGNWSEFDYRRDARSHLVASRQAYSSCGIPLLNASTTGLIDVLPVV